MRGTVATCRSIFAGRTVSAVGVGVQSTVHASCNRTSGHLQENCVVFLYNEEKGTGLAEALL